MRLRYYTAFTAAVIIRTSVHALARRDAVVTALVDQSAGNPNQAATQANIACERRFRATTAILAALQANQALPALAK